MLKKIGASTVEAALLKTVNVFTLSVLIQGLKVTKRVALIAGICLGSRKHLPVTQEAKSNHAE